MTPQRRSELRALSDAATAGPWHAGWINMRCILNHEHRGEGCDYRVVGIITDRDCNRAVSTNTRELIGLNANDADPDPWILTAEDAAFIAASRQAVPELLDALEAAELQLSQLRRTYDANP